MVSLIVAMAVVLFVLWLSLAAAKAHNLKLAKEAEEAKQAEEDKQGRENQFKIRCEELAILTAEFLRVYAYMPEVDREQLWQPVKQAVRRSGRCAQKLRDPLPDLLMSIELATALIEAAPTQPNPPS
ncbi:MAG: hypothetical protein K2W95_24820 [Candidatus Obscuribacterales bacterium]|nr:hypothetical protein [Candidatus Obscuribacterales bacterium]